MTEPLILSFTKLSRYEQCPKAYELHYLERHPAEAGVPLRFGTVIHTVVERLIRELLEGERSGPLSTDRALALYREAWAAEGLSGLALFEEGVAILRAFVRDQGILDHLDLLALEQRFELRVGDFTVIGAIDRIDRVDDETIEVQDYKTNRQLFTREEVDGSLQLSIYGLAAQQLWPWARRIRLAFVMLRHGVRLVTTRSPEQLDAARAYIETLGEQMQSATELPPRLNANCIYCDHRRRCPAYAAALRGERTVVCEDPDDLQAVAREREEVARLAKILGARKDELERILKAHLQNRDELVLGDVRYRMFNTARVEYPLGPTLGVLQRFSDQARDALLDRIARVDKDALDAVTGELAKGQDRSRAGLLRLELDAIAEKRLAPRFWATPVAR